MKPDVLIIGSGMGGATVAAALADTGRPILIVERGEQLPDSDHARDPQAIFGAGHFRSPEEWLDGEGKPFNARMFYYVGGSTKFYGAVLLRYRAEDFRPMRHLGGKTPGWPVTYDEYEPWYTRAEALFQVRGAAGEDPTEPPRSAPYPYPPVPDEAEIADVRRRLRGIGLHPSSLPLGVDIARWLERGQHPWDGFPDTRSGKMDAETILLTRALERSNVELATRTRVRRLVADQDGNVTGAVVERNGKAELIEAGTVVLAAGAVNSAAILLASGLANSSDQVGRNFMNHNCSAVLAVHPWRHNRSIYQKTLMVNDFYLRGGPDDMPLGNIQLLGRVSRPILKITSGLPGWLAGPIADRAVDFYAMSEDLPSPDSRVTLKGEQIVLNWPRSNWETHLALVAKLKSVLRKAGFPIVLSKPFDRATPSHQCGTARMGNDPRTSVVDPWGRSHDHPNLWVADASVLPTSAAVNPALTVAAHALRVGHAIAEAA
ncbi:GMC family oxidoreductase (plasmid) [Paracoccus sp. TK19116]|uniref:GMC family oxidoreductase n=1 Tax=Paracoccus albicereus TaxID=2922394 RepID=A0ABT1MM73_9RHOB|nr:GMC family oxidoreductase [Paracoccus albicereus]MCQ0969390.1 GMC family oxidoreductase [Paracoccus albicereus]